jgi:hypothetical protein
MLLKQGKHKISLKRNYVWFSYIRCSKNKSS